jgi:GNAT superfamily N-acetyltransferase
MALLMTQLGYDVPDEKVADRLTRRSARREVFVVLLSDEVVGWAAVSTDEPFVEGFSAQLEGLIVEEGSRSRGAGALLLDAVEAWARTRNCTVIRVQSNVVRQRAHGFYEHHGYATIKTQFHLRKTL